MQVIYLCLGVDNAGSPVFIFLGNGILAIYPAYYRHLKALSQEANWLASSLHRWKPWWLSGAGFYRCWLNMVLKHEEEEQNLDLHPGVNALNVSFSGWLFSSHLIPFTICPHYQVTFDQYHKGWTYSVSYSHLVCYLVTNYPHTFLGSFAFILIACFVSQSQ